MGLTAQQAFRMGFLLRCAEEGLSPDEIRQRTKAAMEKKASGFGVGDAKSIAKDLMSLGVTWYKVPLLISALSVGGSALAGGAAGYGLGKMQEEHVDADAAKRQELIAAYETQAEIARQRAKNRTYRRPPPAGPRLM